MVEAIRFGFADARGKADGREAGRASQTDEVRLGCRLCRKLSQETASGDLVISGIEFDSQPFAPGELSCCKGG